MPRPHPPSARCTGLRGPACCSPGRERQLSPPRSWGNLPTCFRPDKHPARTRLLRSHAAGARASRTAPRDASWFLRLPLRPPSAAGLPDRSTGRPPLLRRPRHPCMDQHGPPAGRLRGHGATPQLPRRDSTTSPGSPSRSSRLSRHPPCTARRPGILSLPPAPSSIPSSLPLRDAPLPPTSWGPVPYQHPVVHDDLWTSPMTWGLVPTPPATPYARRPAGRLALLAGRSITLVSEPLARLLLHSLSPALRSRLALHGTHFWSAHHPPQATSATAPPHAPAAAPQL